MQVIEKPWGVTRCIHYSPTTEVWHASIRKGGKSSVHRHRTCHNHFYVISGILRLNLIHVDDVDIIKVLCGGDEFHVNYPMWHQFESVTDVEVIETYFSGGEMTHGDIERREEVPLGC